MTTRSANPVNKIADSKGRICLGKEYAGRPVIVSRPEDGVVEIKLAEAIPVKEAWLYKNKEALDALMRGLVQTGRGEFVDGPDLEEDAKIIAAMEE